MTKRAMYDAHVSTKTPDSPLLQLENIHVRFRARGGPEKWFDAVRGVSLSLNRGETLGLVGESGSGKSTLGRAALRLIDVHSGVIRFDGNDLLAVGDARSMRAVRRRMQVIFQDPGGAMNPRQRVWRIVSEPLLVQGVETNRSKLRARAEELLDRCGMPADSAARRPHEFSGGQRQRIMIARAIALNPDLIVCDEPTSALDVSVQAQILNLLRDLQDDHGMAYLFISHDMGVIRHMCDRVAVMRAGEIVEQGDVDHVISDPDHAYTRSLLESVPRLDGVLG